MTVIVSLILPRVQYLLNNVLFTYCTVWKLSHVRMTCFVNMVGAFLIGELEIRSCLRNF